MPPATATRRARPSRARERTRTLLIDAALRVFARKGAGASAIHEIAAEAGVANGTFYNYFRTREELLEAASMRLVERFFQDITDSAVTIGDPAERVAIGTRRFILQALRDPTWGAALLRVWASTPMVIEHTAAPVVIDLRAGRRRRRFAFKNEQAAIDLVSGSVLSAMRTVLEGRAGEEHATEVAAMILRGLGIAPGEAAEIVQRPLPAI
jgi:AcrR family transcriptional regulator